MKDLEKVYLEHEALITAKVPEIKHVDLWSEQVSFLQDEHPFNAPAVFFAYGSNNMDDLGIKVQKVNLQVDVYLYFETFADTARGAKRQAKGLSFLELLSKINACFHGVNGNYFMEMRRNGFAPVDTGTANLLYVQRYECGMIDDAAEVLSETAEVNDVDVIKEKTIVPDVDGEDDFYSIEVN